MSSRRIRIGRLRAAEKCGGCSGVSGQHPVVAIAKRGDLPVAPVVVRGKWAAYPVCHECWVDPAHRKRLIKGHFFVREFANRAVVAAGSRDIGG